MMYFEDVRENTAEICQAFEKLRTKPGACCLVTPAPNAAPWSINFGEIDIKMGLAAFKQFSTDLPKGPSAHFGPGDMN